MSQYRLPQQVRYRIVADEAVILRLEPHTVHGMNWTGARILELFEEGATEAEVVEQLVAEVEAERSVLAGDVRDFVARLLDAGILEIASDT